MNNIIIPKENNNIPDSWGITIKYYDGTKEEFKVVTSAYHSGVFSFVTYEDTWHDRVVDKIKGVDYDKDFSRFMALKKENKK